MIRLSSDALVVSYDPSTAQGCVSGTIFTRLPSPTNKPWRQACGTALEAVLGQSESTERVLSALLLIVKMSGKLQQQVE